MSAVLINDCSRYRILYINSLGTCPWNAKFSRAAVLMKTVMITGGAGFIGSALVRMFIADSDNAILNVDKLTYAGNLDSLAEVSDHPRYTCSRTDIRDHETLRRLLEHYHPDAIIHLAAESHVDRSIDGPAEFIQTNVVGTFTLLQEPRAYWARLAPRAKATSRFVHVSTDEVFGSLGPTGAFAEDTPYAPNSP